jgi:acyl-CoA thioester hydrolase
LSAAGPSQPPAGKTFRFPIRVYYEDTDAAGVVYYANYLKFMERARTEWLAALGFELADLEAAFGVVFVVHRAEIEYRLPARLGERLDATLALLELGRARMVALQQVLRGEDLLTMSRVTLACVDRATFRPARIPAPLHRRLEDPA